MKTPLTLLTFAACALAFLTLAPAASAQAGGSAKLQAIAQQLQLTPKQKLEVMPILKEEAPKLQAIKNNPSMPGMQKVQELKAIHAQSAPQLQRILSPAQYQKLEAIRNQEIQQAIAKKRAARGG
jgi:hypothetical protein